MGAMKLGVMQFEKKFLILLMLVVIFEGLRMVSAQCDTDNECFSHDECPPAHFCCPWQIARCADGGGVCAKNCA
ncbi:hypothetical protein SUGI_1308320 [Cryptomeria japonica]|uniref:Uncharacterized protein n=1 Tax=Cryptomeria japonica TaxID=3369 RepID=A0AAD3NRB2_CRYJA|nr:hypothetical protein SUGI_1308080 [Cryptomeria japonica]GLJ57301.1 hypothetical protein SUGI_1308290 [Cryptomeria japonica]GLJ57302.1 hypothetical protein SUGI_1308320 [Cryptomeria japonica]